MPAYDYRCNACGRSLTLFYKNYADYDAATHTCPYCASTDLTRLISRVALPKPTRDYSRMSSGEMLSVLNGGDSREVGEMFHQVGHDQALNDAGLRNAVDRLRSGDSPERIEADVNAASKPAADKPTTDKPA